MKPFMDQDFRLSSPTARRLYHDYAAPAPIVDYHCHINPAEIAENRRFENIAQAWLAGDHYKWRLMRSNGVEEWLITGDATDREKFQAYAEALPLAIGNPLYHWTHLELRRYFDCELPLNGQTAEEIWNHCNACLQDDSLRVQGIIRRSKVRVIATTDDPVDDLQSHRAIAADPNRAAQVYPAWRPDKAVNIDKPGFSHYIATLGGATGMEIGDMATLRRALEQRLEHFQSLGCRASDHGLDAAVYAPASEAALNGILTKALAGQVVSQEESNCYKYAAVLRYLAGEYARRDWVMELHFSVLRNPNRVMFQQLGPDMGFDCLNSGGCIAALPAFLDELYAAGELPKTILFSLNPQDNAAIGTILGSFQGTRAAGKLQQGSAWWFNDTRTGMTEQMTSLASLSLLGNFLGMLTDSRSFLSYTRHEYFRRILCELLGGWVENGEYPNDIMALGRMVEGICYYNAMNYFGYQAISKG